MSKLGDTLHDFVSRVAVDRRLALVGGLAVSARTEPRFTRDVDLVVAVADDAEAETVVRDAQHLGYLVEATVEQVGTGRLATVRLRRSPTEPIVDLLFASSGIEAEIAAAATRILVLGQPVPVATVGHLIAMKLLSRDTRQRPRDDDDLAALARIADDVTWAQTADAIDSITARGFARRRDLRAALAELRAREPG